MTEHTPKYLIEVASITENHQAHNQISVVVAYLKYITTHTFEAVNSFATDHTNLTQNPNPFEAVYSPQKMKQPYTESNHQQTFVYLISQWKRYH